MKALTVQARTLCGEVFLMVKATLAGSPVAMILADSRDTGVSGTASTTTRAMEPWELAKTLSESRVPHPTVVKARANRFSRMIEPPDPANVSRAFIAAKHIRNSSSGTTRRGAAGGQPSFGARANIHFLGYS
jgi:hypothetical protein